MTRTPQQMVTEYHDLTHSATGVPVNSASPNLINLRINLIQEELDELLDEFRLHKVDEPKALKELADLVYVVYGMAVAFGWNLDKAVERVHENNVGRMRQDDGTIRRREDGKILRNLNYPNVNLEDLV